MNCIHCGAALVEHTDQNAKQGAQHCFDCGCCFLADGKTIRIQACGVEAHIPAEPQPAVEEEKPRGRR